MKSTIKVGSDGIFTKLVDTDNIKEVKEWAESLKNAIKQLYKKTGKKVIVLTDLTECKLSRDVGIKQIITDIEKENAPYVEKSAAYTPNFALRTIAKLLGKISGRRNFLVFKTQAEALKWLKTSEKGKSREGVVKETVHEVYNLLKESSENTQEDVLDYVGRLHDYSKMETDEEFELYAVQEGAVLISYNYLKENASISEEEATEYIVKNYSDLLKKYSSLEE